MSDALVSRIRRRGEEVRDAWPAAEEGPELEERPELEESVEPDDESELEFEELPCTDDSRWDAFIPDDDECDPLPEEGDFWGIDDC
jgi:hypothetical protein